MRSIILESLEDIVHQLRHGRRVDVSVGSSKDEYRCVGEERARNDPRCPGLRP
jgi:hypothetical protein